MRLPRVRFTVRRMMVAVAFIAIILAIEIALYGFASGMVPEFAGRSRYVFATWCFLQLVPGLPAGIAWATWMGNRIRRHWLDDPRTVAEAPAEVNWRPGDGLS